MKDYNYQDLWRKKKVFKSIDTSSAKFANYASFAQKLENNRK